MGTASNSLVSSGEGCEIFGLPERILRPTEDYTARFGLPRIPSRRRHRPTVKSRCGSGADSFSSRKMYLNATSSLARNPELAATSGDEYQVYSDSRSPKKGGDAYRSALVSHKNSVLSESPVRGQVQSNSKNTKPAPQMIIEKKVLVGICDRPISRRPRGDSTMLTCPGPKKPIIRRLATDDPWLDSDTISLTIRDGKDSTIRTVVCYRESLTTNFKGLVISQRSHYISVRTDFSAARYMLAKFSALAELPPSEAELWTDIDRGNVLRVLESARQLGVPAEIKDCIEFIRRNLSDVIKGRPQIPPAVAVSLADALTVLCIA